MNEIFLLLLTATGLLFAANFAIRNTIVNKYSKRYFLVAVAIDVIILINESILIVLFWGDNVFLQTLSNGITYFLAPYLPYFIMLIHVGEWKFKHKLLLIPAIFNSLLVITTPKTHLIFYVTEDSVYCRGDLFILSTAISAFYFLLIAITCYKKYKTLDYHDRLFITAILTFAFAGILIEVIFPEILSMWPTSAVTLQLYYLFELEMTHRYDALTGVWNRNTYTEKIATLTNANDYCVLICDLNNLKKVNDVYGHDSGDRYIIHCADILKECFHNIGNVYRIGGDEFCIIATGNVYSALESKINKMNSLLDNCNKNYAFPVTMSIAYGYEHHIPGSPQTFEEIFAVADQNMYELKKQQHESINVVTKK